MEIELVGGPMDGLHMEIGDLRTSIIFPMLTTRAIKNPEDPVSIHDMVYEMTNRVIKKRRVYKYVKKT